MPALSRHAVTRTALLAVTDTGAVLLAVLAAITLTQTGGTLLERIFSQLPFVAIFLAAWFAAAFHEDLFASQRKE
ncbi:MAG TPA: hypothetical protein PKO36_08975, partial [Candidatus Hydrogenedentes bacterium]|nr:hypothetical protein [Candidatus Hydrogenedentota bacterium]